MGLACNPELHFPFQTACRPLKRAAMCVSSIECDIDYICSPITPAKAVTNYTECMPIFSLANYEVTGYIRDPKLSEIETTLDAG